MHNCESPTMHSSGLVAALLYGDLILKSCTCKLCLTQRKRTANTCFAFTTGGRRFGMITALLKTCAVSGTTACSAGPSRTCRWKSSGFVIVSVDAAAAAMLTQWRTSGLHAHRHILRELFSATPTIPDGQTCRCCYRCCCHVHTLPERRSALQIAMYQQDAL